MHSCFSLKLLHEPESSFQNETTELWLIKIYSYPSCKTVFWWKNMFIRWATSAAVLLYSWSELVCECVCACANLCLGEREGGSRELWEKDTATCDRLKSRVTDSGEIAWERMWGCSSFPSSPPPFCSLSLQTSFTREWSMSYCICAPFVFEVSCSVCFPWVAVEGSTVVEWDKLCFLFLCVFSLFPFFDVCIAMHQALDTLSDSTSSTTANDLDLIFLKGIMESPVVRMTSINKYINKCVECVCGVDVFCGSAAEELWGSGFVMKLLAQNRW